MTAASTAPSRGGPLLPVTRESDSHSGTHAWRARPDPRRHNHIDPIKLLLLGVVVVSLLYVVHLQSQSMQPRLGSTSPGRGAAAGPRGPRRFHRHDLARAAAHPARRLRNLVLVAGHAVYTGLNYADATHESSWFLEPYQQVEGEARSFLTHIRLGIEAAARDPDALLLFSGGQTRVQAGPRSEGVSYWVVAEAAGWFNHTDEHARDSFENLLFSLCRFYELTGHYPEHITVVSYTLKQRRFEELHRAAVHFPHERFTFIGSPIPPAAKGALEGEARTVAGFKQDPYGCSGDLMAKKERRDPFAVGPPHPDRCPDMAALLSYCPDDARLFAGPVPWAVGGPADVSETQ